jgi:hypothetical protein
MWSPEFNNAAIVEYTAAIPEAKAKPAVALPSYILFHKLISVRVAVAAIIFLSFSSANDARMSSASSNTKLEVIQWYRVL